MDSIKSRVAILERFMKKEHPRVDKKVNKISKKVNKIDKELGIILELSKNGSFKKMSPYQYWTLIIAILAVLVTSLLKT